LISQYVLAVDLPGGYLLPEAGIVDENVLVVDGRVPGCVFR
jgi:hypothetical protein